MNENLPTPINNNTDLQLYESYLDKLQNSGMQGKPKWTIEERNMSYIPTDNKNLPESLTNTAYMPAYLSKHIGKLVRVEFLLSNQLHQRTGILMTVGAGFIALRSKNNATLICEAKSIRFVTVIHDNDLNSLLNNY